MRFDIRPVDLANHLGISTQALSNVFATQDIKTGMLEKAAAYKGISPAAFYLRDTDVLFTSINNSNVAQGDGATITQDNPSVVSTLLAEMAELRKMNARLVELLAKQGKIG